MQLLLGLLRQAEREECALAAVAQHHLQAEHCVVHMTR
jgi:hypothetical protein